jgi:glycosyltransferase involved in cell wall biosynthesis
LTAGTPPSVSVVVAARNAEAFVEESLRSALDQTVPPSQIVVVDDGSTDATAAIADAMDPRVTVLRRPHAGVGPSRNAGLDAADGLYLALLDADDVWLPAKLELQLEAFAADPTREAVFTWFDEFVDPEHPPPPGTRAPRTGQSASLSTGLLLPRAIVDRIGPFGQGANADWMAWWTRARGLGVVEHVVPEVLYRRRIHSSNNSFVHRDEGAAFVAVAREHLRVRRERAAAEDATEPAAGDEL